MKDEYGRYEDEELKVGFKIDEVNVQN